MICNCDTCIFKKCCFCSDKSDEKYIEVHIDGHGVKRIPSGFNVRTNLQSGPSLPKSINYCDKCCYKENKKTRSEMLKNIRL
uniref:Uncharacterized protein n=1 Tax=viral metagenome TaxID=1070528 RepID=A0A6C0JQS4_9ZZZZ